MALYPVVRVDQNALAEAVERVKAKLDPKDVLLLRYSVGEDWVGEPTIFFRILLSDDAAQRSRLGTVGRRVKDVIYNELETWQNSGLWPYFTFRSESEQRARYDPEWV